jgi:hypothetical protein
MLFTGLSINVPGMGYTLHATDTAGLTDAYSLVFDIS